MKVLILDNSVATTGAFLSAVAMADTLRTDIKFNFVLPNCSNCHAAATDAGFTSLPFPMVEISRSVFRLVAYVPMLLLNGLRLRWFMAKQHIDLLVANDYYNQLPLMVRILGWRGPIVTIVRLLPDSQMPLLNRLWLKSMQWATSTTLAVSKVVIRQLPVSLEPHLIYFPVGRGIEKAGYIQPVKGDGCRFLYLANYIRGKGQEQALEAFAIVLAQVPTATLKFVGGDMGLDKNQQFRTWLKTRAIALGVDHSVVFSGPTSNVVDEMRGADVVLNFSRAESYSQTCVEAGHLGRPVVATRCGGPEEVIVDGETGYLVALDDIDASSIAMAHLAVNPALRLEMGRKANEFTGSNFGVDQFRVAMRPLFNSLRFKKNSP